MAQKCRFPQELALLWRAGNQLGAQKNVVSFAMRAILD